MISYKLLIILIIHKYIYIRVSHQNTMILQSIQFLITGVIVA